MAGIILTIEVDDKGSVKVKQFADETKKAFDEMKKGPQQAQGSLNSLKESWMGLTAKVTAATAAVYGITKAFSSFVNEAAEAEQVENRLRYALETTGYTWQYAKGAVDEFANSIHRMTRFSDDEARRSLTTLMLYTNDFSKAQEGARIAMNLSVRTGHDLDSALRLVGMGMTGNVEMLGRLLPQFKNLNTVLGENATEAEKAQYFWKIMRQLFGKEIQGDLETYSGQMKNLIKEWREFKEVIGGFLIGPAKDFIVWLKEGVQLWKNFLGGDPEAKRKRVLELQLRLLDDLYVKEQSLLESGKLRGSQIFLTEERINNILEQRKPILEELALIDQKKAESAQKLAAETKKDVFPDEKKKIEELKILKHWTEELWQAEDKYHFESVARSEAILDMERRRIISLQTQDEWIDQLGGAWGDAALKALLYEQAAEEAIDANQRAITELLKPTSDLENLWDSLGKNLSSAWSSNMVNIIRSTESTSEKIKSFFQSIGDAFLSTVSKMTANWLIFGNITGQSKEKGGGWGGVLGLVSGLLKFGEGGIVHGWKPIQSYQHGGVVTRPTLGLIGEGGQPEAVVPLKDGKIPVEGKTGETIIVQNYVQVTDPDNFVRLYGPIVKKLSEDSVAEARRFNKMSVRG